MTDKTQETKGCLASSCLVWMIPIPFIIVGGLILLATGFDAFKSNDTDKWPSTLGKVTQSSVLMRKDWKRFQSSSTTSNTIIYYLPDIRYSFNVDGQDYTGSAISFVLHGFPEKSGAQKVADQYPIGRSVTVYYDADSPNNCCLDTTFEKATLIFPVIGSILCLIGVGLLSTFCFLTVKARLEDKKMAKS